MSKHFRDRKARNGHESQSPQAVEEFLNTLGRFEKHPKYIEESIPGAYCGA